MSIFWPAFLILAYTAWNARELFASMRSNVEVGSYFSFAIWLIPIIDYRLFRKKTTPPSNSLMILALVFSLIGVLGDVNTICFIGFSLALAAFVPFMWWGLPWIFSMVTWIWAFGYFSLHYFYDYAIYVRFSLVVLATAWMVFISRKQGDNQ